MLRKITEHEGALMDTPESVSKIPDFIRQHNIDITEIEKPLDQFRTSHLRRAFVSLFHVLNVRFRILF